MKLTAFQNEILNVVQNAGGYFLSAYQICNALEEQYPAVWAQLVAEYPSEGNRLRWVQGQISHTHQQHMSRKPLSIRGKMVQRLGKNTFRVKMLNSTE